VAKVIRWMRWHLLRFVPLLIIAFATSLGSVFLGIANTAAVVRYLGFRSLGSLFSPNAYLWACSEPFAVVAPF
jgi:hypothetical protein